MKRGLALALLTLATSGVVSAQIHGMPPSVTSFGPGRGSTPGGHASVTSLGPRGFAGTFSPNRARAGAAFGHNPRFGIRRRFSPTYYWPYYGYYEYPYGDYYGDVYPQQSAVVDPPPSDDRYGDHTFEEARISPPRPKAPPAAPEEQDPTVLVFRDGHKQEVRNYAIVGQMLWDFGANGTHKIPLSDLDLDTTRKLNDERGVDFVLPKT